MIGTSPILVATYPGLPAKTVKELIDYAKAYPGKINYGSSGVGGLTHVATVLFLMMTQTDMTHVPYKGTAPAMTDLLGGQVQVLFGGITSEMPYVRSGRLRGMAVTAPKRLPALPDIPTVGETVPGYEAVFGYGVWGPPAMPRDIVASLTAALKTIVSMQETKDQLGKDGVGAEYMPPEQFGKFLSNEVVKWGKVMKAGGVKAE